MTSAYEILPIETSCAVDTPEAAGDAHDHSETPDQAQGPAPDAGEAARFLAPYLSEHARTSGLERWNAVQAEFVDDPRQSVADAHQLVGELVQRIIDEFTSERAGLEKQWSSGQQVSTEELRLCVQRYRAFFSRLLPAVSESE